MSVIHTPSSERGATGLTAKRLDPLSATVFTISNQDVDMSVCNPGVRARSVGAGKALGVHPFRGSPPAFDLAPGTDRERGRLHTRREGGGEATGGTIKRGARLEETLDCGAQRHCSRVGSAMMGPVMMTKLCQRENEEEQEQEQEHMKVHTNPLCLK